MERYFEAIGLKDEATKVRTATLYLIDNATLWWRRKFLEMEKGTCTINTWEDFKKEIKKQFYPEDVEYMARKKIKHLKHTGSIRDYVKEFSSLMLEAPGMDEKDLLFNFMDNLQSWAEQELRRRGFQDLSTAMEQNLLWISEEETRPKQSHYPRVVMLQVGETEGTRTIMLLKKDPMRPLLAEKAKVETSVETSSQGAAVSCAMDHIGLANVLRGRPLVL